METRSTLAFVITLLFGIWTDFVICEKEPSFVHSVNVIVIGSSGDLAKRKIWPSIRELVFEGYLTDVSFNIYAATRNPVYISSKWFNEYFSTLSCDDKWKLNNTQCDQLNNKMIEIVKPVQLEADNDFKILHELIRTDMNIQHATEITRIFYLSVPPFAYDSISKCINLFARPLDNATLRVAIEKPFGKSLQSAQQLVNNLYTHFKSNEIFLIDHYLHKRGVTQIFEFRKANHEELNKVWNGDHIEYIEIVANEKVNIKGRSKYYNEYGVIRDMLQSHLTEILTILTADIHNTSSAEEVNNAKLDILKLVYSPLTEGAIIGQYSDYQKHLTEDDTITNRSYTLTFASVVMYIRNTQWSNVPIILMSGKNLLKKETFVTVYFKCKLNLKSNCNNFITFRIGDREKGHSIIVSLNGGLYSLPDVKTWTSITETDKNNCITTVMIPSYKVVSEYSSVFESLVKGRNELFVPLPNVLESWRIWSPLLEEVEEMSDKMIIYPSGISWLNNVTFVVSGTSMSIKENYLTQCSHQDLSVEKFKFVSSSLEHIKTLTRSQLAIDLANDLYHTAVTSVMEKDAFHIALPGGSSLTDLYQVLVLNYKYTFPWSNTHIWQTDERCVKLSSPDSNMFQISRHLLEYVPIPYSNIHPLAPDCSLTEGEGYVSHTLDYALLGVGIDGHIASLFDVILTNATLEHIKLPIDHPAKVKERVSLSVHKLLQSKSINIVLTGQNKCHVANAIASNNETFPVVKFIKLAKNTNIKVWIDKNICQNNN